MSCGERRERGRSVACGQLCMVFGHRLHLSQSAFGVFLRMVARGRELESQVEGVAGAGQSV